MVLMGVVASIFLSQPSIRRVLMVDKLSTGMRPLARLYIIFANPPRALSEKDQAPSPCHFSQKKKGPFQAIGRLSSSQKLHLCTLLTISLRNIFLNWRCAISSRLFTPPSYRVTFRVIELLQHLRRLAHLRISDSEHINRHRVP